MARERRGPDDDEPREAELDEEEGLEDEDFQFALKELLAAYEPVLAEDRERARDAERLQKEVRENLPTCDEEFELAGRIFDKFVTEDVAQRLLPVEGREQLGSIEEWRWCLRHIRCCIIFGWLVCRRPWTFRAFNYYLYRYWRCVRQTLDAPIADPPSAEDREDFAVLVSRALARIQAVPDRPAGDGRVPARDSRRGDRRHDRLRRGRGGGGGSLRAAVDRRGRAGAARPQGVRGAPSARELLVLSLLVSLRDPLRLLPRARTHAAGRRAVPQALPPLPAPLLPPVAVRDHEAGRERVRGRADGSRARTSSASRSSERRPARSATTTRSSGSLRARPTAPTARSASSTRAARRRARAASSTGRSAT